MPRTVPTKKADVPHPPWCKGAAENCDARGSYTHTSPRTVIKTSITTRLEIYVEGGTVGVTPPVLVVEEYGCNCRSCDARVLLVLDLPHAGAAYEAMGRLLDAVGAEQ